MKRVSVSHLLSFLLGLVQALGKPNKWGRECRELQHESRLIIWMWSYFNPLRFSAVPPWEHKRQPVRALLSKQLVSFLGLILMVVKHRMCYPVILHWTWSQGKKRWANSNFSCGSHGCSCCRIWPGLCSAVGLTCTCFVFKKKRAWFSLGLPVGSEGVLFGLLLGWQISERNNLQGGEHLFWFTARGSVRGWLDCVEAEHHEGENGRSRLVSTV